MKYIKIDDLEDVYPERIEGTSEWYCGKIAKNCFCDLYEAEEIIKSGQAYDGMTCVLIHFPDGKVYYPFVNKENVYIDSPVFWDGVLYFLVVDFNEKIIQIVAFDTQDYTLEVIKELSLDQVENCYNLRLDIAPILLIQDSKENQLQVIYPEKKSFEMSNRETFLFRDEDKAYFSEWFEDPDYHEVVIVRDWETGTEIERFDGQLCRMPNGDIWRM